MLLDPQFPAASVSFPKKILNWKLHFFELGVSDQRHLIYIMLKTIFAKTQPGLVRYRNKNMFQPSLFERDLSNSLNCYFSYYDDFDLTFTSAFNCHAPKKDKMKQRKPQTSHE